ncbi:two-component system response regulator KdpE [soil metagenome]
MSRSCVILVVEDEPQIRRFVRSALEAQGWSVVEAGTVRDAVARAEAEPPDLVILDLGLPDGDGVDFLHRLRGWSPVPVIVLSARTDEADKVTALDAGADDYLTKPFSVAEMAARVRAGLRRGRREAAPIALSFGDIRVDLAARRVFKAEQPVHLTPIEYRLLQALIANIGRVMTHRHLLREVWGPNHSEHTHYLRIYMAQLRQKLERDPARPRHFVTETGIGYRLLTDDDLTE